MNLSLRAAGEGRAATEDRHTLLSRPNLARRNETLTCPARALLRQPPPLGVAVACSAVATFALAYEIDVCIVSVGRPMALKIVEKHRPIAIETIFVEVAERKGECVVQSRERRNVLAELLDQPFGERSPRPVFPGPGGGGTSIGGASSLSATKTRMPGRLCSGVSAPE